MTENFTANNIPVVGVVPIMTVEMFSQVTGVEQGVVRGWIEKGYIPAVKIGKYRVINVVELTRQMMSVDGLNSSDTVETL